MTRKRVLAVRLDSMGDLLVTGPALRAIAGSDDVDELMLLCSPGAEPTARILPGISRVVTWSCPWIVSPAPEVSASEIESLVKDVSAAGIDEAVIFTSFHQSPLPLAMLLRLAGVTRITGVSTDYAGSLLDERIRPDEDISDDLPEVERGLAIAARAGYELPFDDDARPRVVETHGELERQCAQTQALIASARVIVVHPGASVPARRWSPLHLHDTVRLLTREGWTVVVTGSPDERELTAFVAGTDGIDVGGKLDVSGLADLLRMSAAIVVGNTGPAHLAAAVGTPVVSLFSPVVPPRRWLPYGVEVEMLGEQFAACRGTRARECPIPGHPCLNTVTPAEVVAAVHRLLTRREQAVHHRPEEEPIRQRFAVRSSS